MCMYLQREKMLDAKGLCNLREKDRTRASGWKLKPDRFKSEIRHICLAVRMINHWNKLLREGVNSLSLADFKSKSNVFLKVRPQLSTIYYCTFQNTWNSLACAVQKGNTDDLRIVFYLKIYESIQTATRRPHTAFQMHSHPSTLYTCSYIALLMHTHWYRHALYKSKLTPNHINTHSHTLSTHTDPCTYYVQSHAYKQACPHIQAHKCPNSVSPLHCSGNSQHCMSVSGGEGLCACD